jgi:hypothetical protein
LKSARASPPKPTQRSVEKTVELKPKRLSGKSVLDPKFVAAAKASRRKFGPLFKRLAKT